MADSTAWFALAGALGGVTLTGVLGLVTAGLNHKWGEQTRVEAYRQQQLQMITDQRREVGYKYLVATNSYFLTAEQLYFKVLRREEFDRIEHMRPAVTALHDTYAYLTITCGTEVRKLGHSYNDALYAAHDAAEQADVAKWGELYPKTLRARAILRDAIRAELGVTDLYLKNGEGCHAAMEVMSGTPVTEVARRYGVSRQAVHGWLSRYERDGLTGLADHSHRPLSVPAAGRRGAGADWFTYIERALRTDDHD